MTKPITFWFMTAMIIALCSTTWSATLTLRNGAKLSGDLVSKTDEHVVLKTPAGLVTQQWRACTPATIKALHPSLYQRLLKQAEARKKKEEEEMAGKGMVRVDGKWMDKHQAAMARLSKVRLGVNLSDDISPFERIARDRYASQYQRQCCSVLSIKLDGLDRSREYHLKVVYSHYATYFGPIYTGLMKGQDITTDKDVVHEIRIAKEESKDLKFTTKPFRQYKQSLRYSSGKSESLYGYKSDGWDISIWLDNILIFEQKKNNQPVYHYVTKW